MTFFEFLLITFFIIINLAILLEDIKKRRISNRYLIGLILILPFWAYIYFPRDFSLLLPWIIFSVILFIVGIFYHEKNTFLGAWDIKYAAVLLLFLSGKTLKVFISNIGILTFLTLILWLSLIIWQLIALEWNFLKKIAFEKKIDLRKVGISVVKWLLEWIIIGFLLYLLIEDIAIFGLAWIQSSKDFFFILMMILFFLRPWIHYLFSDWKHRIITISIAFIYIASKIQDQGFIFIQEKLIQFVGSIWIYILVFGIWNSISMKVFSFYDRWIEKNENVIRLHTIPYSFILFLSFCWVFFFQVSFMDLIF